MTRILSRGEHDTLYRAAAAAAELRRHRSGEASDRSHPRPDTTPVRDVLTDGEPSNEAVATQQVRTASYESVLRQLKEVGSDRFSSRERLVGLDYLDEQCTGNAECALPARLTTEHPDSTRTCSGGLLR